jgi:hypothetical protein
MLTTQAPPRLPVRHSTKLDVNVLKQVPGSVSLRYPSGAERVRRTAPSLISFPVWTISPAMKPATLSTDGLCTKIE